MESSGNDDSNDTRAHAWHPGTGKVKFGSRTKWTSTLVFVERTFINGGSVGGYEFAKFDIVTGPNAVILQGFSNTFGALAGVCVSATEAIVGHGGWSAVLFVIVTAYATAGLLFYLCVDAKSIAER